MKKIISSLFIVAASAMLFVYFGCGDGSHRRIPGWTTGGGNFGGWSQPTTDESKEGVGGEDEGDPLLECVDVTDYKNIVEEEYDEAGEDEELTTGDITTKVTAVESMQMLSSKASNSFQKCIKAEIKKLKKGGPSCLHFWGNGTMLLTREKFYRKPKKDQVEFVEFMSCSQIKKADCLLID